MGGDIAGEAIRFESSEPFSTFGEGTCDTEFNGSALAHRAKIGLLLDEHRRPMQVLRDFLLVNPIVEARCDQRLEAGDGLLRIDAATVRDFGAGL